MYFPLRVVHVVNVRWFNATAWYGLSLARLMRDAGHTVRVLALRDTEAFFWAQKQGLNPEACNVNSANPAVLAASLRHITALVNDFRPHIVNCHRGEGLVLWGALKHFCPPFALVRTRGDQRPPKSNWPNRYVHRNWVDAVIATNSRIYRQCRELLDIPAQRLSVVPGGVDTDVFFPDPAGRAAARDRYGFAEDDFVVGILGRFDPVKGHRELIDAARALRRQSAFRSVRFFIVGYPTAQGGEEMLRCLLEQAGLHDTVVVSEKTDAPNALINAMDLGVIASQGSEAIARAAFEMMACGVPLIGTDVGVMPDLLAPGALAPVGNAEALETLLAKAVSEQGFRDTLRREQAEGMSRFSHRAFLEQTLSIYYSILLHHTTGPTAT